MSQHIIHKPKKTKRTENILFFETKKKNSRNTLKPPHPTRYVNIDIIILDVVSKSSLSQKGS